MLTFKNVVQFFQRHTSSSIKILTELPEDQKHVLMSVLWQNPAMQLYLDKREKYLIDLTAEAVVMGNIPDSKFTAGRLMELRELRSQMKVSHHRVAKKQEEKRVLTKVENK